MTPWEWSLAALLLAPVAACVFSVGFAQNPKVDRFIGWSVTLAGLGGVVACLYGLTAADALTLETNMFFGMVAGLDKFSSMLFMPFAVIVMCSGLLWNARQKVQEAQDRLFTCLGIMLVIYGAIFTVLAGNIIGLGAALGMAVFGALILLSLRYRDAEISGVSLWFIKAFTGMLAVVLGLFVLSSGALFNDFSTLSYIAAELDTSRLAAGSALILLGALLLGGACWYQQARLRALVRGLGSLERGILSAAFFMIPMYLMLRMVLFVLPPLSVWYALPVALFGIATMIASVRMMKSHESVAESLDLHVLGLTTFGISAAIAFQALSSYSAMNIVLFGALTTGIFGMLTAFTSQERAQSAQDGATFARGLTVLDRLAVLSLPPSPLFVGAWMMLSAIVAYFSSTPRWSAVWLALGVLVTLGTLARRGKVGVGDNTLSEAKQNVAADRVMPILSLLLGICAFGGMVLPSIFVMLGADPLTLGIPGLGDGVIAGDGALRVIYLVFALYALAALVWLLRDKTKHLVIHDEEAPEHHRGSYKWPERMFEKFSPARAMFLRFSEKTVRFAHAWYDRQQTRRLTPAYILLLVTVILCILFVV